MMSFDEALAKVDNQFFNPDEKEPNMAAVKKTTTAKPAAAKAPAKVAAPAPKAAAAEKPVVKKAAQAAPAADPNSVTLADLAKEMGKSPALLRRTLRAADVARPDGRWVWKANSKELAAVRKALTS